MRYLLGEVVVLVVGHAGGDVVDDLGSGGGVVRRRLTCTAIPLEPSHEATVSSEVHLRDKHTRRIHKKYELPFQPFTALKPRIKKK